MNIESVAVYWSILLFRAVQTNRFFPMIIWRLILSDKLCIIKRNGRADKKLDGIASDML